MNAIKRTIFFISDGTGITAKTLGHSLLTQFETIHFETITYPYVDDLSKAEAVLIDINTVAQQSAMKPIIFATLLKPELRQLIATSHAMFLDLFGTFIDPLEHELKTKSSHAIGRSHEMNMAYNQRIEAINFALHHDDGRTDHHLEEASIILIGVSRSGKTPTCIYLAMQFGILAANYPLTEEDILTYHLPTELSPYQTKLFGLTIDAKRLQKIRQERCPNTRYATLAQCQLEVAKVEILFQKLNIPYLNVTTISVEEIAAHILQVARLEKAVY